MLLVPTSNTIGSVRAGWMPPISVWSSKVYLTYRAVTGAKSAISAQRGELVRRRIPAPIRHGGTILDVCVERNVMSLDVGQDAPPDIEVLAVDEAGEGVSAGCPGEREDHGRRSRGYERPRFSCAMLRASAASLAGPDVSRSECRGNRRRRGVKTVLTGIMDRFGRASLPHLFKDRNR